MHLNGFEIAVIGISCRFPGAGNVDQFWRNLREGVESISFFSDAELLAAGVDAKTLANPSFVKAGGVLPDVDMFDASFFGYSPREAEIIDPQQRFFLECAWEALENAGYDPQAVEEMTGVFAGVGLNGYMLNIYSAQEFFRTTDTLQIALGNDKDYLATRVSYKLNLKGPGINVQSACSTSLLATHLGCQSLLSGACDMALAGGVTISVPQKTGYLYREGGIASPDGHTRAFDAAAQGCVGGSGAGVVVLKRLEDALKSGDSILAVIKGSAANNDGSFKVGFTAPSVAGQAGVISAALNLAEVSPETITYVETHGTGTRLGDPIEVAALTQAFREHTAKLSFCAIGSVKTNIGHLDTAAGVAGLIKTVLALKHKEIPPSLHFQKPNPEIDFAQTPFFINQHLAHWKANGHPCRAGISSFGIGGTNVHLILEEAPILPPTDAGKSWQLLVSSARTKTALQQSTLALAQHLKQNPELNLADVSYTLQAGRTSFNHRQIILCQDRDEAIRMLEAPDAKQCWTGVTDLTEQPLVFMFPGQGGQHVNMARDLYETDLFFREMVDSCCEQLKKYLGFDLRPILYPTEESAEPNAATQLKQTLITQPALFVIEYALAKLLGRWGVQPQAMIGHSIGEYVAACIAGVFTLDEALQLIAVRGRLMQELPGGSMLSVPLPESELTTLLRDGRLSLATVNGPSLCVVSGTTEEIDKLSHYFAKDEIECKTLHTSHAFHSMMMDPVVGPFRKELESVSLNPPSIPYISNVTGNWITDEEATDPDYWLKHLRLTVRFDDGLRELLKAHQLLVEVGPGSTLSALAQRHPAKPAKLLSIPALRHPRGAQSDAFCLLRTLGQLWLRGVKIYWPQLHAPAERRRVPLPTYPFERKRFWIERQPFGDTSQQSSSMQKLEIDEWFYAPVWKESLLPAEQAARTFRWLLFVDDCGLGTQLSAALLREGHEVITVRPGTHFVKIDEDEYEIDPRRPSDYDTLLAELLTTGAGPDKLVHLWNVTQNDPHASLEDILDRGFYSLVLLAQALGQHFFAAGLDTPLDAAASINLIVVSNALHKVLGDEDLSPVKATLLGPCRVIPQEYPKVSCRSIDVMLAPPETRQDKLLAQLLAELKAAVNQPVIAYRKGKRWVQTFESLRLQQQANAPPVLREKGVYLITGGLGGVGLEIAEYLTRTVRARLVLLSRTKIAERNQWPRYLSTHDSSDELSKKINRIKNLERLGSDVLILSADVANEQELAAALTEARRTYGCINGVVHAAGIPSASLIQRETRETAGRVLSPKLRGTRLLSALLRDDNLDFFLLCSSLRAFTGGPGATAYCAANAFLDAFAQAQDLDSKPLTIAIDWDGWVSVGMSLKAALLEEKAELADLGMSAHEGVETLHRILWNPLPQIVVSTHSLQAVLDQQSSINRNAILDEYSASRATTAVHPRPELENSYVAPQNPTEQILASIWSELLGLEKVGRDDNFFDLGGDSVVSLQIIARAKQSGLHLTMKQVFEHQTVAGLAAAATGNLPSIDGATQDLVTGPVPLTPIQCWFFEQKFHHPNHFNQSVLLEVKRKLEYDLLVKVVRELLRHHDALRFRFTRRDGSWEQMALGLEAGAPCDELNLSHLKSTEQQAGIEKTAAEFQASLDLSNGPTMRVALFRLGDRPDRLLIVIHHLIVDAISWRILLEDFETIYGQLERGEPARLPAKTTSFKEWATRLEQYAKSDDLQVELALWLGRAQMEITPLPVDHAQAANTAGSTRTVDVSLDEAETAALLRVGPKINQARIDEALLATLAKTFKEWIGGPLLIDLEGHGREPVFADTDLSRTVGWFTPIYPVVLDVADGPIEALQSVKEQLGRIKHGGLGYGLLRYLRREPETAARLQALPQPEVSFLYLGKFDQVLPESGPYAMAGESSGPYCHPEENRTHLLQIVGHIAAGRLQLSWAYSENVHRRETIEAVALRFIHSLRELIEVSSAGKAENSVIAEFNWTRRQVAEIATALKRIDATENGVEDFYPLTPVQQGILFHNLFSPKTRAYFQQFDFRINGHLDVRAFRRAWHKVIERHPSLRTGFFWEGLAEPVQVVYRRADLRFKEYDWSALEPLAQEQKLNELLDEDRAEGFVLSRPPLMRLALIRLADDKYHFIWSCHHLLLDGWSRYTVSRELFAFYEAFSKGRFIELEPPGSYRDYVVWLRRQNLLEAEGFWRGMLKDAVSTPILPELGTAGLPGEEAGYSEQLLELSAATTATLLSLGRLHRLTMNTIVMGAWALLLSRHSCQRDVLFGVVMSGRPPDLPGVESMVGLFVNTLPMRIRVAAEDPVVSWLEKIKQQQLEIQKYEYSPLAEVQQWSDHLLGQLLFETIFAFENFPTVSLSDIGRTGLEIVVETAFEQTSYPLTVMVASGERLSLRMLYDDLRIDHPTVTLLLRHFETLLENMARDFNQPVAAIEIVPSAEREQRLHHFNDNLEVC